MKKIGIATLVCAVLLLALLGATVARSGSEDWRSWQARYLEQWKAKGGSGTAPPVEVKQDRLLGFGEERIDRCRSCHVAVDDPKFKDGKEPLRTHVSIAPHTFGEWACTVCHEGDGRALDADLAHGKDHFWPEPLLKGAFIESACARCHRAPYPAQASHLRRGRELFEKYACVGCHTVQGLSRGNIGPELSDIGNKRKHDFLLQKVEKPRFNQPQTLMPPFHIPETDRVDLVVFLKSLRGPTPIAEDAMARRARMKRFKDEVPADVEVSVQAGKKAFEARGCVSCHKLGAQDGKLAPDLGYLGQVRSAEWVEAHVADPRQHVPGSSMPTFFTSRTERRAIAAYLTSLSGLAPPAQPAEQYAQLCARCHGEKGAGDGPAAETLLPRPRIFTNAKFFNWLPEERAYRAIRDGVPGTAMPPFGKLLDEKQAQALFGWIRTNFLGEQRTQPPVPRKVPEKSAVAYSPESVKRGKAAFLERCYGCHGRIGDGKGPNAPEMLPRPRNLTTRLFFQDVSDSRLYESITYGIVGTGMPPWDMLSEDQRWDLVNYVRFLSSTGPAATGRGQ